MHLRLLDWRDVNEDVGQAVVLADEQFIAGDFLGTDRLFAILQLRHFRSRTIQNELADDVTPIAAGFLRSRTVGRRRLFGRARQNG